MRNDDILNNFKSDGHEPCTDINTKNPIPTQSGTTNTIATDINTTGWPKQRKHQKYTHNTHRCSEPRERQTETKKWKVYQWVQHTEGHNKQDNGHYIKNNANGKDINDQDHHQKSEQTELGTYNS